MFTLGCWIKFWLVSALLCFSALFCVDDKLSEAIDSFGFVELNVHGDFLIGIDDSGLFGRIIDDISFDHGALI